MNMSKRMQILKMQDELRKVGIAPDLVDLNALVDERLSYPENYRNIMARYKRVDNTARKGGSLTFGMGGNIDLSYAAMFHQARSPQAQNTDNAKTAQRTYTERQVARNPSILDAWMRNPGRIDLLGIDAFGRPKPTIKRKVKHR